MYIRLRRLQLRSRDRKSLIWQYGGASPTDRREMDKAHMISGAIRYTTAGEQCNYNRHLSVVTYRKGRWGITGSFSYIAPHDRANDMV